MARGIIQTLFDAWDHADNFERVHTGPGIYGLFDSRRIGFAGLVYVGMSTVDVVMRVAAHRRDKSFETVAVLLPQTTSERFIRDVEALVLAEHFDRYGELPFYNRAFPTPSRIFSVRRIPRRPSDVLFE